MNLKEAKYNRELIIKKMNFNEYNTMKLSKYGLEVNKKIVKVSENYICDPIVISIDSSLVAIKEKDALKIEVTYG